MQNATRILILQTLIKHPYLFYATYDSSFIDYVSGKTQAESNLLEGGQGLWFADNYECSSLFADTYYKMIAMAVEKQHDDEQIAAGDYDEDV